MIRHCSPLHSSSVAHPISLELIVQWVYLHVRTWKSNSPQQSDRRCNQVPNFMGVQGGLVQDLRGEVQQLQAEIKAQQAAMQTMVAQREASRSAVAEASDSSQVQLCNGIVAWLHACFGLLLAIHMCSNQGWSSCFLDWQLWTWADNHSG